MDFPADLERRRQAWSSYWAAGGLHSCIGKLVDDPEGAIGRFWRGQFAQLRSGQRVLDLATGNGAVPKLLLESSVDGVHVDAVDLAALKPTWLSPQAHPVITFHPGVAMEALPFQAGQFDLVVSQFGLEYARWPAALEEMARVCRDEGRVALVMHHADSVIVRMAHTEQAQQAALLADDGLVAAAIALLPYLVKVAAGERPGASANQARGAYNEAMRQIAERIEHEPAVDLLVEARQHIHSILGGHYVAEPQSRHLMLLEYQKALVDASLRTHELISCALDEERVDALLVALEQRLPGRRLESVHLHEAHGIVAWGVTAA